MNSLVLVNAIDPFRQQNTRDVYDDFVYSVYSKKKMYISIYIKFD